MNKILIAIGGRGNSELFGAEKAGARIIFLDTLRSEISKDSEYNNVFILRANNKFGSIGIGPDNELRCFRRDNKKYRWAKLEGFKEKEIYEKLGDEMLEEVSLEAMAEHFTNR